MSKRLLRAILLSLPIVVITYYYGYFDAGSGEELTCYVYESTGLLCPGCGGQRAVHALLQGNVKEALAFNGMILLFLPLLILFYIAMVEIYILRNNNFKCRFKLPYWFGYVLIVVVLAFSIVRNL